MKGKTGRYAQKRQAGRDRQGERDWNEVADRKCWTEGAVPPKLHPPIDQGQGNEVLLAVLAVVEQNARGLGGPELHCDAHGVVGTHGLEGQVGLATEGWDEVLDDCRERRQA